MKCSRCQQENQPDHKFCLECGTPLQRASASVQPTLSYAGLQHSLTEAREQQTATSEILRVISQSQTDVQPVFDAIVRNAVQLCGALRGAVYRVENGMIHFVAHHNFTPEGLEARRRAFPQPLSAPGDPMARMTAEGQVARTSDSEVDAAIDPESRSHWGTATRTHSRTITSRYSRPSPIKPSSRSRTCGCSRSWRGRIGR